MIWELDSCLRWEIVQLFDMVAVQLYDMVAVQLFEMGGVLLLLHVSFVFYGICSCTVVVLLKKVVLLLYDIVAVLDGTLGQFFELVDGYVTL